MAKSRISNPVLPETGANPETSPESLAVGLLGNNGAPSAAAEQEEREIALGDADKRAIDDIILSTDVQKGGKIRIERRGLNDQEYAYLATIPAEAWNTERSTEWIKQQFGGGDYRCRTFRANGQMYKPFMFKIDHRIKGALDEAEMRRLGERGQDINQRLLDELKRPPIDPMAGQMMKMFEMSSQKSDQMFMMMMQMNAESQKTMATVMAAALGSKGNGIDPVILDLLKSANTPKSSMMEIVEVMKVMKELSSGKGEETDKEPEDMMSKVTRMISAGAPLLASLISGGGQPAAGHVPSQSMPVTQPLPESQPIPPAEDPRVQAMRQKLAFLIHQAEKNSDPSIYADLICDMTSPEELQGLISHLTKDNWPVILLGNEDCIRHVRPWFDELRNLIIANATEDANPNANPSEPASTTGSPEVQPAGRPI